MATSRSSASASGLDFEPSRPLQDAWRHTPRSQGHGSDESEPYASAHLQEQQEPAPSACCFPHKSYMRWCYASLSAGCRSAPCQLCHAYDNHWRPQKPPGLPKAPKLAAPTKPAAAASSIPTSTVARISTSPRWGDEDEDEADGLDLSDLFEQTPWVKQGLEELAAAEQQQAEAAAAAPAAASESGGGSSSSSSIAPRTSISSSGGASSSWADEVEAHEEAEEELDLGSLADWMKEGLAEQAAAAAAASGTSGNPSGRRWADDVEEEDGDFGAYLASLSPWMAQELAAMAEAEAQEECVLAAAEEEQEEAVVTEREDAPDSPLSSCCCAVPDSARTSRSASSCSLLSVAAAAGSEAPQQSVEAAAEESSVDKEACTAAGGSSMGSCVVPPTAAVQQGDEWQSPVTPSRLRLTIELAAAAWAEQERELEEFAALERACGCFPPPAAVAAW